MWLSGCGPLLTHVLLSRPAPACVSQGCSACDVSARPVSCPHTPRFRFLPCRLIFRGLPERVAQMRREDSMEIVMFGPRITLERHKRRLIEVRPPFTPPPPFPASPLYRTRKPDPLLPPTPLFFTTRAYSCVAIHAFPPVPSLPVDRAQVVISDESPLVNIRLDDPVLQDIYSATVVAIRPRSAHHDPVATPCTCGNMHA
jgi:hypothetical protein